MTPSLVNIASSAQRLRKSAVTDDRAKLLSSFFARVCTSAIANAAATNKATLDDYVKRSYIKHYPKLRSQHFFVAVSYVVKYVWRRATDYTLG